ncbi:uncharacterized protein LOC142624463 [Castanea sativa]|uniref:uncharacterized protein LOC142624463 n=1 Tax=Castanea sativa TaxID=21020 RepID=UPI003F649972
MEKKKQGEELLETLGDFTSKENWDRFFSIRGSDDSFEWYAEWAELRGPLLSHLQQQQQQREHQPNMQILVPACGNSRLSEHLYDDAALKAITNIDFSKVVISDMLRRNVRQRPEMRWRVMDITTMQFMDETFDAVVDKGGLDALMEPQLGPKLGIQYLSEVMRILKSGGKFICLTLAESHVLGLLFSKLRFGWKMIIEAIPQTQKPSRKPSLQTFMVVAEKEMSSTLYEITALFNSDSLDCSGVQACGINEALENENQIRRGYSNGSHILYSLEDLQLGAKGDLTKLCQGRRFQLTLGGQGGSLFSYRAILLDARQHSGSFMYHCGVFIVPKTRAHDWLFSSEEGQWMVVESSKAARLIMVLLDTCHNNASMDDIQKDLSPLVKQLAPGKEDNGAQIPFMMASDGIKQRNIIHQVISPLSGPVIVEDVVYENVDVDVRLLPSGDLIFRRLIFERTRSLVQSEALLAKEGSEKINQIERKKTSSSSKSKRRGPKEIIELSNQLKVYHSYLASAYHRGIISGFVLISSYMESVVSTGKTVKTLVIGLGAGLLPMFLHECIRFLHIETVELDPVILNLARDYFGFTEDKGLKVHIADGIQYVREIANSVEANAVSAFHGNGDTSCTSNCPPNENCMAYHLEGRGTTKVDIVIVDVDSSDSSSGLTCPAADFVEESFLQIVKDSLSEQGLFVINLVSRSSAVKDMVVSRMKAVFSHLFGLQLEEEVNEVLFALRSESCIGEGCLPEAALKLGKLLKFKHPEMSQRILDGTKKVRYLK